MHYRLSLANVARFEPLIRKLVETSGSTKLCFNTSPLNLAPSTASARLSDAVLSLLNNHTTLPNLDVALLRLARQRVYITTEPSGVVCFVPRTKKETTSTLTVEVVTSTTEDTPDLCVLNTTDAQFDSLLNALALLLGMRVLSGRVRIRGTVDTRLEEEVTNKYDVALVPEGKDWIML